MNWKIAIVIVTLLILLQLALTLTSWRRPNLGLRADLTGNKHLLPCPDSDNCVCSEDDSAGHAIEPLAFTGDGPEHMELLKRLCVDRFGWQLLVEQPGYMRFACVTPIARYVDDLEFRLDESDRVIHIRSASRVGRSDLGKNRQRVQTIRQAFGG